MLQLLWWFGSFTHLGRSESPPKFNNLFFFYHPGPLHNISLQSINDFLSIVAYRQTNTTENITSFAKVVAITTSLKTIQGNCHVNSLNHPITIFIQNGTSFKLQRKHPFNEAITEALMSHKVIANRNPSPFTIEYYVHYLHYVTNRFLVDVTTTQGYF